MSGIEQVSPESTLGEWQAQEVQTTNISLESERASCSAMLRSAQALGDRTLHSKLASLLAPEDFHFEQHQAIWSIASSMQAAGLPSDAIAISDAAARQDIFVGGPSYLAGLIDDPLLRAATPVSIHEAAKRVKQLSIIRRMQKSIARAAAMTEAGHSFDAVASFLEDDIANLRSATSSSRTGPRHLYSFIDTVVARMEAHRDGDEFPEGAKTGFESFDRLTGGLLPETFTVLAARPAMGKTAVAMNIEQNIARGGRPTLLFSLEMTGSTLAQRHIASHSRIPLNDIKRAVLTDRQWRDFSETVEALRATPCYIDDSPGLNMNEIRARARAFIGEHPTGVIFLDYLQLVSHGPDVKVFDQTAHIRNVSKSLKAMARELRCPVVALAQLGRDMEKRANKRPMMSDLKESGQIEQDAEVIVFLYRDEVYNPDTPDRGVTEVIVGKNRDGETGTVRMVFEGATMTFSEIEGVLPND